MDSPFFYCYKNYNYQSNKIDTLSLGGGGYYGLLNISLIKHLEELDELKNIKKIYCVSAGTIFGLLIIIGVSWKECVDLMLTDIIMEQILDIKPCNIFNIVDKLGINDGSYLEEIIKNVLFKYGFSPYITLKELYDTTLIEYYIGVSYVFKDNFKLLSYKTHPDMPVWFAIRASTAIPLIFQPLLDIETNDYICDGGLLCNNPIKYALLDKQVISDGKYSIHSNDIELSKQFPLMKYKTNIISTDFKIQLPLYETKPTIIQYITTLSRKIFVNQSGYNKCFSNLIHTFKAIDYPEINYANFKIDADLLNMLLDRSYNELKSFFNNITN
jgi:hypothetical protein